MVGEHHQFNGNELGQNPGDSERQGHLVCCSPWGCKESNMTWQLNNEEQRKSSLTYLWVASGEVGMMTQVKEHMISYIQENFFSPTLGTTLPSGSPLTLKLMSPFQVCLLKATLSPSVYSNHVLVPLGYMFPVGVTLPQGSKNWFWGDEKPFFLWVKHKENTQTDVPCSVSVELKCHCLGGGGAGQEQKWPKVLVSMVIKKTRLKNSTPDRTPQQSHGQLTCLGWISDPEPLLSLSGMSAMPPVIVSHRAPFKR